LPLGEVLKAFLAQQPKIVVFGEFAGSDDVSGDPAAKLEALTQKKLAADKNLSYSAAFAEVQQENPELTLEYRQV
jgi:hypothetical protein